MINTNDLVYYGNLINPAAYPGPNLPPRGFIYSGPSHFAADISPGQLRAERLLKNALRRGRGGGAVDFSQRKYVPPGWITATEARSRTRALTPCRYYKQKRCTRGDACPFKHSFSKKSRKRRSRRSRRRVSRRRRSRVSRRRRSRVSRRRR